MEKARYTTPGLAALALGVQVHVLDRWARRKLIPVAKAGRFRLVDEDDPPAIRAKLVAAGFVKNAEAAGA